MRRHVWWLGVLCLDLGRQPDATTGHSSDGIHNSEHNSASGSIVNLIKKYDPALLHSKRALRNFWKAWYIAFTKCRSAKGARGKAVVKKARNKSPERSVFKVGDHGLQSL